MGLYVQLLGIIFNFSFGVGYFLLFVLLRKFFFSVRMVIHIICSLIFNLIISGLYFFFMYCLNFGQLHLYFFLLFLFGIFTGMFFVKAFVKK